jgi:hypothetical protein
MPISDITKFSFLKISLLIILSFAMFNKEINGFKTKDIFDSEEENDILLKRLNFYRNFVTEINFPVSIEIEDNRIVVKSNIYNLSENFTNYPKNFIINSCEYFPYLEQIYNAFFSNNKDLVIEDFMHSLFLTFKIMYFQYGNHKAAEEYYILDKGNMDIPFYSNPQIKSYFEMIPNTRNIFDLDEDEINLAKKLNISMKYREIYSLIYKGIIENIKANTDKVASVKKYKK